MFHARHAAAAASFLLLAFQPAMARTFTNADLAGGYTFALGAASERDDIYEADEHSIGTIVADGNGNITATRSVTWRAKSSNDTVLWRVQQEGVGTYSIGASGLGSMTITWSPDRPSVPFGTGTYPGAAGCSRLHFDATESYDIALGDSGFEMTQFVGRTHVKDCPPEHDPDGYFTHTYEAAFQGRATRQDGPCAPKAAEAPPEARVRARR